MNFQFDGEESALTADFALPHVSTFANQIAEQQNSGEHLVTTRGCSICGQKSKLTTRTVRTDVCTTCFRASGLRSHYGAIETLKRWPTCSKCAKKFRLTSRKDRRDLCSDCYRKSGARYDSLREKRKALASFCRVCNKRMNITITRPENRTGVCFACRSASGQRNKKRRKGEKEIHWISCETCGKKARPTEGRPLPGLCCDCYKKTQTYRDIFNKRAREVTAAKREAKREYLEIEREAKAKEALRKKQEREKKKQELEAVTCETCRFWTRANGCDHSWPEYRRRGLLTAKYCATYFPIKEKELHESRV